MSEPRTLKRPKKLSAPPEKAKKRRKSDEVEEVFLESESHNAEQRCNENDAQHRLTKIEKANPRLLSTGQTVNATSRKDCRNCYKNKKRVNTTMECKTCPGSPPLCFDCFFDLHYCTAK